MGLPIFKNKFIEKQIFNIKKDHKEGNGNELFNLFYETQLIIDEHFKIRDATEEWHTKFYQYLTLQTALSICILDEFTEDDSWWSCFKNAIKEFFLLR